MHSTHTQHTQHWQKMIRLDNIVGRSVGIVERALDMNTASRVFMWVGECRGVRATGDGRRVTDDSRVDITGVRSIALAVRAFQLAHSDWRRRGAVRRSGRASDFTGLILRRRHVARLRPICIATTKRGHAVESSGGSCYASTARTQSTLLFDQLFVRAHIRLLCQRTWQISLVLLWLCCMCIRYI